MLMPGFKKGHWPDPPSTKRPSNSVSRQIFFLSFAKCVKKRVAEPILLLLLPLLLDILGFGTLWRDLSMKTIRPSRDCSLQLCIQVAGRSRAAAATAQPEVTACLDLGFGHHFHRWHQGLTSWGGSNRAPSGLSSITAVSNRYYFLWQKIYPLEAYC